MPSLADFLRPSLPFPVVSDNWSVQSHYNQCRLGGTSHKMAEMFAFQAAPSLNTDTRWLSGHDFAINPDTLGGSRILSEAKEAGVTTRGKVYKAGLAEFPGDPRAWVESRADCIRRAEALGLELEGGINYKPPEKIEPTPLGSTPYRVADDLVQDQWEQAVAADPGLDSKKDAKEELVAKLAGDV